MESLASFRVIEELGESLHSTVFKVESDRRPGEHLVLRQIKPQFRAAGLSQFLALQIENIGHLHLPATVIPELHETRGEEKDALAEVFLITPYIHGTPLNRWVEARGQCSLEEALSLGSMIADLLEPMHQAGQMHKGLKPANILIGPGSNFCPYIIDDVRVLDINELSHFIHDDAFCRETLRYITPEQTGRIQHAVDYTTDLYSLGIILYELLSGSAPFTSEDPLALIHAHLAEVPVPLIERNSAIPQTVSDIVDTLLMKPPERRYQTALGVKRDIDRCLKDLRGAHAVSEFTLRAHDHSNRITIPSVMVGRESEKKGLLAEYDQSSQGEFRAAVVSGFSGIGKTRLIRELELPIVATRGYYTAGKFDQYKKQIPYGPLIEALRNLMRTFLTEDRARVDYWQETLQAALGEQGQLVIEIVPELEIIIGKQAPVPTLGPTEARNRFNDTLGRFIAALASAQHPLTLFIDDLQWCDNATFDIIEILLDNPHEYNHLLWLGAYRHNEVGEGHRLRWILDKQRKSKNALLEMHLEALSLEHVNQMTAYILNTWPTRTTALADVIFRTSDGNPLFVNESLRWLHTHRHLRLDPGGSWQWDDDKIQHTAIPSTALELFKHKIEALPEGDREMLELGACLGASFDAHVLARCTGMTAPELNARLAEIFSLNLLRHSKGTISFFHDQVQAAAESFMDETMLKARHAHIARIMIQDVPEGADLQHLPELFSIVEHLAQGRDPEADVHTQRREAAYNYAAGLRAMGAMALDNAAHFFRECKSLMSDDAWTAEYDFLFSLHKNLARAEMATGQQRRSEATLKILLSHARTDLDRADCLYEQTAGLSSMGVFAQAIKLGNEGLDLFERSIPDDDALALQRSAEIIKEIHAAGDVWQKILDVSPSGNRATQIETAIYSELIPDYYLAGRVPQLYLAAIQSTQNCLAGGVDESVIYGFSMVGLYLQRQDDYEKSFKYEDLGIALAHRYPDTFGATKGINGILWTNMHNRRHVEHVIDKCRENIHRGKTCGDLYNSGLSYGPLIWNMIAKGNALDEVADVAAECVAFSGKFNLSLSLGLAESALAGWTEVMNPGEATTTLAEIDEKLRTWTDAQHVVSIGGYYTLKGIAAHFMGEYAKATKCLNDAQPYLRGLSDNILNRLWYVFTFVNDARSPGPISQGRNERMAHCMERVETWTALGPILKPYLAFMIAEQTRCDGDSNATRNAYLIAIDAANEAAYTLLEGHLNECLARELAERKSSYAGMSFQNALVLYRKCGASSMEHRLDKRLTPSSLPTTIQQDKLPISRSTDVEYMLRAGHAISRELDPTEVQRVIMHSLMERMGATHGFLVLVEDTGLTLTVQGTKNEGAVSISTLNDEPADSPPMSMALVRYVARSQETLRISDAQKSEEFQHDPEVRMFSIRSVLCAPITHQKQHIGVLYLQNTLLPAAFDPQAEELVRVLSTQAAVSLQNAQLYDALRASRQQLQSIMDNTSAVISIKDTEGRYLVVNQQYERVLGMSADQIVGKSDGDIFPPHVARQIVHGDSRAVSASTSIEHEHLLPHADGAHTYAATKCSLRDAANVPYAICSVAADITARKRMEVALRRNEQLLATAEETGRVGSWEHNPDTGETKMSRNFHAIVGPADTGRPVENLDELLALVHDADRDELSDCIDALFRQGAPFSSEFRLVSHTRGVCTIAARAKINVATGDVASRMTGIFQDVTELRRAERAVRQGEKMRAVGQLAAGVAHDINNLLAPVVGYADLMQADMKHDDPMRDLAGEIKDAGRRARDIIQQLLIFGRKQQLNAEPTDITRVIVEFRAMLRSMLREDIDLVFALAPNTGLTVCDGTQIERLLLNLTANAMHAMPRGGTLTVTTESCTLDAVACAEFPDLIPGAYIHLRVEDSGVGMDEATKAHIFEPFFTTREPGAGTGLGLSTVYGIVEQHRGAISVSTEIDHGTSFDVYLPQLAADATLVALEQEKPFAEPAVHDFDASQYCVLVAEDDAAVLKVTTTILEKQGYKVLQAKSGRDALRVLESEPAQPDLLLTDVVMPGIDGAELVRLVRPSYPNIAVIYMSGHSRDLLSDRGALKDGVELLPKPFTAEALIERIQKVIMAHQNSESSKAQESQEESGSTQPSPR